MPEVTEHSPGTFCWVELATSDAEGAKQFYTELFGWTHHDDPIGEDAVYTMLQIGGRNTAALYQLNQEMKAQGVPPNWLSYVTVADADDTVERVRANGGTAVRDAFDVFDIGRMAVLQDPQGATFAVWQPKKSIGAQVLNEPGTFCWNELATRDPDGAGGFYAKVFDWRPDQQEMPAGSYTIFKKGETQAAGMLRMTEEWGNIPPHWMVYFSVEDCDETVQKAKALGAKVTIDSIEIPHVGRFAVLQDPQGAVFSVIHLKEGTQAAG